MADHALEAVSLHVAPPSFGEPRLRSSIVLPAATGLTVGSPTLGEPRIAEVIEATGLTVGSPSFGTPKLTRWWQPSVFPEEGEIIDHPGSRILYRAASGLEKAMADADGERLIDLNAELVNEVWNPYKISAKNLPYLAWGMGVNYWDFEWSESTKREWTARQWEFKGQRGAEGGIAMALDFAGRDHTGGYELVQVVAPPGGFFLAPNLTKEQWDSWIRLMPQIRVKFATYTGDGDSEFFLEPAEGWDNTQIDEIGVAAESSGFIGYNFIGKDDGPALYGRMAVLRYANGTEIDLRLVEWRDETTSAPDVWIGNVSIPGDVGDNPRGFVLEPEEEGLVAGTIGSGGDGFLGDDTIFICYEDITPKNVQYRLDGHYEHTISTLHLDYIQPGYEPIDVRYERDSDVGVDGPGDGKPQSFYVGDGFIADPDAAFVDEGTEAAQMLADRIYLLDPDVVEPMMLGISFVGVDRLTVPPYHAWLLVDLKTKESAPAWYIGEGFIGDDESFLGPEDLSDFDRALRAVVASKALRDKIGVAFDVVHPITFNELEWSNEETTFGTHIRTIL